MLGLDLAQFLFGAQIDRAQPLALAAQPFELFLDLGEVGQRLAFLDLGQCGDRRRLDLQHVVDFAADVGEPALGALEAFLGAGEFLARGAGRFERGAGVAVGFGQRVLGLLPGGRRRRGARLPPWRLRRSGPCASRRKPAARFPVRRGRAWPRRCAARAWRSGCARRRAARSSRPCRRRAPRAACRRVPPRARSPAARRAPRRAWRACRRCRRARAASLLSSSAAGASAASARSASALAALASSRLAVRRVRASASAESRAAWRLRSRSRARVSAFGVAGGIEGGLRGLERACACPSTSARADHQFAVDLGKAAALREPPRRAGRRVRRRDEAVPAPQVAFARDQPLAGLERGGELAAGRRGRPRRSAPAGARAAPAP